MTRMQSRPVQITQVYPQDTAPTDKRDGVLWVDTSVSPPKTKTWDADSNQWAPVATSAVDVQNTEPNAPENGDIWVDTSLTPPRAKVYDSTNAVWDKQAREAHLPLSFTDNLSDVTEYSVNETNGATLVSVTGSGLLLDCQIIGAADGAGDYSVSLTVDGGTTQTLNPMRYYNENGWRNGHVNIPPIRFESSLDVVINSGNSGDDQGARAWVKQ